MCFCGAQHKALGIHKRTSEETWHSREDRLIHEEEAKLFYKGSLLARQPVSPDHLEEWARGYLVTEGFCSRNTPLEIRQEGTTLSVHPQKELPLPEDLPPLPPLSEKIAVQTLFSALRALQEAPLYRTTGAAHGAALFDFSGKLLVLREDVGRYNAAEKTLGWLCTHPRAPEKIFLLFSGRIPRKLVQKAVRARIPFLGSISAPTFEAAALAREKNLTLGGFMRPPKMNLYSAGALSLEENPS